MDFDESIFGPLRHSKVHKERRRKQFAATREARVAVGVSASTTMDVDKSIFSPVQHKKPRRYTSDIQWVSEKPLFPVISSLECDEERGPLGGHGHNKTRREKRHQLKQPPSLTVSEDASASIVSEDASASMDCDESIFGSLGYGNLQSECKWRKDANHRGSVPPKPIPNSGAGSFNTTLYNESILGPLLEAKKKGKGNDVAAGGRRNGFESGARNSVDQKRKASTFEVMMKSLEQSSSMRPGDPQPSEMEPCLERKGDCFCNMHYSTVYVCVLVQYTVDINDDLVFSVCISRSRIQYYWTHPIKNLSTCLNVLL